VSPTQAAELGGIYLLVGITVAAAAILGGIIAAARSGGSGGDVAMYIVMAVIVGAVAGAVWPVSLFIAAAWGVVMAVRAMTKRRAAAKRRAEREARHRPLPETDEQRFDRMAREQLDLAKKSRALGWDEIADMQTELAEQYAATAKMYGTIGAQP
jgi:hypothetical protein